MSYFRIADDQADAFERDGYLFVPGFLTDEETKMVFAAAKENAGMYETSYASKDAQGRESRLNLWNHPPNNIFGTIARCHRMVDTMERLLGGEVYHYHSKVMMKEPRVGGAWEWHQDYGYWYNNGCLFPYMASCMIALDRATRENGCLQILKGSHLMGRVEHGRFGDQTGADPERVRHALERLDHVYCEMEPGTALLFHSNLLHTSDANESDYPRWALICCYNAARNNPYKESGHPRYTPLEKVSDDAIVQAGRQASSAMQ